METGPKSTHSVHGAGGAQGTLSHPLPLCPWRSRRPGLHSPLDILGGRQGQYSCSIVQIRKLSSEMGSVLSKVTKLTGRWIQVPHHCLLGDAPHTEAGSPFIPVTLHGDLSSQLGASPIKCWHHLACRSVVKLPDEELVEPASDPADCGAPAGRLALSEARGCRVEGGCPSCRAPDPRLRPRDPAEHRGRLQGAEQACTGWPRCGVHRHPPNSRPAVHARRASVPLPGHLGACSWRPLTLSSAGALNYCGSPGTNGPLPAP